MAGIILVLMSIAKLGDVIRFIPAPVIVGFTAGIGVTIWVGQWQSFFGFPPIAHAEMFHEKPYFVYLYCLYFNWSKISGKSGRESFV
jgi:SulP family sulfate permease